ncbi:hypothetical protein ACQPZK_18815 [Micromonospora sp. CA-249363]|uniref:hypothetical protein n=1 Tax=Micromonospora sp. CA-249363 TaxID=3239963 RepID=UPI003D8AE0F8
MGTKCGAPLFTIRATDRGKAPAVLAAVVIGLLLTWGPTRDAHAAPAPTPTATATATADKFYVVGDPVDGRREFLFAIAAQTLGDGKRYREIFDLNRGRAQPDGRVMDDPTVLEPGWILLLPADARGPGVRTGPLPSVAPPSTPPSPGAPDSSAEAGPRTDGDGMSPTLLVTLTALLLAALAVPLLILRARRAPTPAGPSRRASGGRRDRTTRTTADARTAVGVVAVPAASAVDPAPAPPVTTRPSAAPMASTAPPSEGARSPARLAPTDKPDAPLVPRLPDETRGAPSGTVPTSATPATSTVEPHRPPLSAAPAPAPAPAPAIVARSSPAADPVALPPVAPTRDTPPTTGPSTAPPRTVEPSTEESSTAGPPAAEPGDAAPATRRPEPAGSREGEPKPAAPLPADSAPADSVPATPLPAAPLPAESAPAKSVPADSAPAESAPAGSVPIAAEQAGPQRVVPPKPAAAPTAAPRLVAPRPLSPAPTAAPQPVTPLTPATPPTRVSPPIAAARPTPVPVPRQPPDDAPFVPAEPSTPPDDLPSVDDEQATDPATQTPAPVVEGLRRAIVLPAGDLQRVAGIGSLAATMPGWFPPLVADLTTDTTTTAVRLVGARPARWGSAYGWLEDGWNPPPSSIPVVLGERDGRRLWVDLAAAPDVLTLGGDPDASRRLGVRLLTQLAPAVDVVVIADVLGVEPLPERTRRLASLDELARLDPVPLRVVFCPATSVGTLWRERRSLTPVGHRTVPVVIGAAPAARWSVRAMAEGLAT